MPPNRSSPDVSDSHPLRERVRPAVATGPELSFSTLWKAAVCIVLGIVATVMVGMEIQSRQSSPIRHRGSRASLRPSILQNAGHVIKRTKGHKIERY